jgi:hypothetical protein
MAVNEKTIEPLEWKSLALPAEIPILDVKTEEYTDWTGDSALRVTVFVDEALDPAKISGEAVGELKHALREGLRKRGSTLFAYIRLVKRSELEEASREE